ncbi:MAG: serine/threonine protein kinase [Muribaculaceae bacterium]|nr:serine/threonine protein kinase [Muribaculaceae bacterium]
MQNLKPGSILHGGTYKIVRFIASGGFGCTYEAKHTMLDSRVAIKEFFVKDFCNRGDDTAQITVGTLSKKGLVDRLRKKFVDEAKALHSLHHPGIVSVTDIFEENGTSYFVMDYIDGESLSAKVKKEGPMSEAQALKYIRQVAEALKYVHANNRLHLDIKPANIMVDGKDNAVLIDFGASKQYDEVNGENTSTLMGKTPGYAPLEQMGNDVVQFFPSTDIYALGATLYKLLTGVTPLSANMLAAGEDLQPLPTNVSAKTANAIKRSMSLKRSERPQSIDDFLNMLPAEGTASTYRPAAAAASTGDLEATALTGPGGRPLGGRDSEATQFMGGNGGGNSGSHPIQPLDLPTADDDDDDDGGKGRGWLPVLVGIIVAAAVGIGGYFAYERWFNEPDVRSVTIEDFDLDVLKGESRGASSYDDYYDSSSPSAAQASGTYYDTYNASAAAADSTDYGYYAPAAAEAW